MSVLQQSPSSSDSDEDDKFKTPALPKRFRKQQQLQQQSSPPPPALLSTAGIISSSKKKRKSAALKENEIISKSSSESSSTQPKQKRARLASAEQNNYVAPGWETPCSEHTDGRFTLEIIKSGVLLDTVVLNQRAHWLVGRGDFSSKLPTTSSSSSSSFFSKTKSMTKTEKSKDDKVFQESLTSSSSSAKSAVDIVTLHPSCSRLHAVLQHRRDGQWFVCDLASLHLTRLNGSQLMPHKYYALSDGDLLTFGTSTRLYIFNHLSRYIPYNLCVKKTNNNIEKIARSKTEKKSATNRRLKWTLLKRLTQAILSEMMV